MRAPPWKEAGLAVLLLSGCAADPQDTANNADSERDPHEALNRKLFAVNDALDHTVLRPAARGYVNAVPATARQNVHNVLSNLGNPAQLANDIMQGAPRRAGNTFMRLLINTTLGLGGVFDVAKTLHYPDHDTDFGLTLAVWGVQEGPYLYLPIIGPSNPRDGIGYGANSALDPFTWVSFGGSATFGLARYGMAAIDARSRFLSATDTIDKTALDRYATYRSLYRQHRAAAEEAARRDLPATPPDWFSSPPPADLTPPLPPAVSASPKTVP